MATILILLSPNRSKSAVPYLIGWVLGLAAVLTGAIALAQIIPVRKIAHPQTALGIALIVIGVGLIVLAVVSISRAREPETGMPKWLTAVGSIGPAKAVGLAIILNLRPKAVLLSAAAGLSMRSAHLSAGETAAVVAVYTVIAASTVAGPIVFSLVAPIRANAWLLTARAWMAKNNRLVTVLILLLIGVVILGEGLTKI